MGSPHRNRPLDAIDLRVASRLRNRRRELQVDPATLDIVIGEPVGTVAQFEEAKRRIPAAHLFRLGQALNVDVPYFFVEEASKCAGEDAGAGDDPPRAAPQVIAEGQRLARIFKQVPDRNLRSLVLRLIKSVAAGEKINK